METELAETFRRIEDVETLKPVLNNTCDQNDTDGPDSLVRSMPRGLRAVNVAGRNATL